MQQLRAVGVEDGAILATSEDGTEFRILLDEEIRARLRTAAPAPGVGRKSNPREIQTYIRGGMSADQVAKYTGAPIEYVQRFEGPILAEREYMVDTAMAVPVLNPHASELAAPATFGSAMEERLGQLAAAHPRWSSWKDPEGGWVLKVTFTADGIEHDARWSFDPKKQQLAPLNNEAVALSQQGDIGATLQPRLRAVPSEQPRQDSTRFDSSAFAIPEDAPELPEPELPTTVAPTLREAAHREPSHRESGQPDAGYREPAPSTGRIRIAQPKTGSIGVIRQEDHSVRESGGTADLLEALRRRRGEREGATFDEEPLRPATSPIRTLERTRVDHPASTPTAEVQRGPRPTPTGPVPVKGGRRGRTSMPSWDEIVFGARPEDDPA
ncbi:MAG: DNA-binding protein [Naasia sp.]|nr:DNA-binding protein [Naasia sp.]